MTDREKVIKAIEICYFGNHSCTECELFYVEDCNDKLMRDALVLLKEQEPVHVQKRKFARLWLWCCGSCGVAITEGDRFCRMCGKAVKWND